MQWSPLTCQSYFPCDPRTAAFDDSELLETLADITNMIEVSNCQNILIAGYLNSNFARNNRFTNTIKDFFVDSNLHVFWDAEHDNIQDVGYTHHSVSNKVSSFSTIDHFVSNQRVLDAVLEAGAIHAAENSSNHSPIFVKLGVGRLQVNVEEYRSVPKTSWCKADEDSKNKYKESVAAKLNSVKVPNLTQCRNLHCTDHSEDILNYTVDVLQAVESAAKENLPVVGGGGGGRHQPSKVPGWKEHVQPYYEESKFWHSLWVSAGKPIDGQLLHLMRDSKHQYKYALRRVQRAKNKIQNDMFLTSIMQGGVNIFKEIKKYRGKVKNCSSTIDGEIGATNIAEHFAGKYEQLYNQNQLGEQITDLKNRLNRKISSQDMVEVNRITESVIRQGLKIMKANKSDAIFDFQSDCLIEGPPEVVTHLTNMIRIFILHGQVPDIILVCTLLPLVKDNLGDLAQSDNYRAIAAGCQILKLLDIVILILEGEKLRCDQLQFGFQPGASTTMCSWMVTSVIDQYIREGSVVYGCAMDLTKAFDMVEWVALFQVLESRNVSPVFLRTLLYVYTHQSCNVGWNGSLSATFKVSNGVRQGAVSSPILFSIYIDDLFSILRGSGFGCRLNS